MCIMFINYLHTLLSIINMKNANKKIMKHFMLTQWNNCLLMFNWL